MLLSTAMSVPTLNPLRTNHVQNCLDFRVGRIGTVANGFVKARYLAVRARDTHTVRDERIGIASADNDLAPCAYDSHDATSTA